MATPNGSRRRGSEADKWPSLFEWAESKAARLGASAQDVCRAARAITTVAVSVLIPLWLTVLLTVTQDTQLLHALAVAAFIALSAFVIAWGVRAVRSRVPRKGITIVIQTATFAGALVSFGVVTVSAWRYQTDIRQVWSEEARIKVDADRKRKNEEESIRKAEAECNKQRDEEIEKAKTAHGVARKRLAECRVVYGKQILPFGTADQFCRVAIRKSSGAKHQLDAANLKTCNTASVK